MLSYRKLDLLRWILAWFDGDVELRWTIEREHRSIGHQWFNMLTTQTHIKAKDLFSITQLLQIDKQTNKNRLN